MNKEFVKKIIYYLWVINGYLGLRSGLQISHPLTILITYYNPVRLKHVNHELRNLLKCEFVEKVVISSHNPSIKIDDYIKVSDPRLILLNHSVRHGCGHRWMVADQFSPEYLIVMDDDILLFPWQLRKLFLALIAEPDLPHSFAGMVKQPNGFLEYHQKTERSVDYICEIYAITGKHLKHYIQLKDQIQKNPGPAKSIEFTEDFIIVSRIGDMQLKIR